jgi:hypothetical protein
MMKRFTATLGITFLMLYVAKANYLLLPMDNMQKNHLKAYGIAFQTLKNEGTVQWLLNYRGGSFILADNETNKQTLALTDVTFEMLTDNQTADIVNTVLKGDKGTNLVSLSKLPKIAVYAPHYNKPYDDAVTLALQYAGIDYKTIYDREVLRNDLNQFDWIHLHHEDFTGQYSKWNYFYSNAAWYKSQKADAEKEATALGFKKVADMKLAVAKKLKSFVENGGQLFAMCTATEALDVALAADGVDIIPAEIDGTVADVDANKKLNFNNTFAFQNFTVNTSARVDDFSNIDIAVANRDLTKDPILLSLVDAQKDVTGAMLAQNHTTSITGFAGQTTAYNRSFVKPNVAVLATNSNPQEVRYLHGHIGAGTFTFLGGHDPAVARHYVGGANTNLDNNKTSAGYRLILNNVLFPSARSKAAGVNNLPNIQLALFPNPVVKHVNIELKSSDIKRIKVALYSLSGQIAFQENIELEQGAFAKKYNTADLAAGIYIVEVSSDKGVLTQQMIVKADE